MAAWTPSDLTNPSFVATQLSGKDRSTALYTVNNELASASVRLAEQSRILLAAQDAANNGPSRGEINALKAKSNDPSVPPADREAAAQQAANLADQRDKLNVAAENALNKYYSTNEYVDQLSRGKENLIQAGTVEPGVNQFAAPPGYEGRSDRQHKFRLVKTPAPRQYRQRSNYKMHHLHIQLLRLIRMQWLPQAPLFQQRNQPHLN